ncbi:MAG: hypothetical protein F6J94_03040 [Moorea sp. SIO1F2]|uniref:hypothetical protein n=1 Tax=unclassified Moorena TaxID=2683338 RepID=UPI0013BC0C1F|nr:MULTISPECIES: hypothetical protein [unclassified Moorena]NEN99974.1 hypothetical protein [Moorena sp. SIO3I7]NEO04347.1 hypothetical protein [Moorena sp. SIO3I8]NET80985.1 hypothetical protein [Moorena sp. SIO1F2]
MKRLFSLLLSGILMVSSTLLLGIAVAEGVAPGQAQALVEESLPEVSLAEESQTEESQTEESLAQCFYSRVSQGKDVKECDSVLEKERNALKSVELKTAARCFKLQNMVETNKPEYLRLYDVRNCHLFIEDSPFWTSVYYGDDDSPCKYNSLYKEYVCE